MSDNAKKKNIGIIVLGIVLLVGMGLLLYPHIRSKIQLKKQLELGQKCLAESDYDQRGCSERLGRGIPGN